MANNTWSNYTEKTATPVDTDEVMARDSTDGKNKRLLFGTFWKWVAKKLNEATISELQTSNKTIVGALNQLNSEKVFKQSQNGWNATHTFKGLTLLLIVDEVDGNTMYLISQNQSYVIGGYRKNSDLEVTSDKASSITTIKNPVGGCNMFAISVL